MGAEWTMPAAASRRRVGRGEEGEDAFGGQKVMIPSWTSSMGGMERCGGRMYGARTPAVTVSQPAATASRY